MATPVLTSIGATFGGPIGGALGSFVGGSLDRSLFAPRGRTDPSAFQIQQASYGGAIPRIYGSYRVAGNVIWSSGVHRERPDGGSTADAPARLLVSIAVALSSRPVVRIGRIWADGQVIREVDGAMRVPGHVRLNVGSEDQAADPLIAGADGLEQSPAYRGTGYVVLEDLDLAVFGGRFPQLSFEVEADTGPLSAVDIAADLLRSAGLEVEVHSRGRPYLAGWLAGSAGSVADEIALLAEIDPFTWSEDGSGRLLLVADPDIVEIPAAELGAAAEVLLAPPSAWRAEQGSERAGEVLIGYQDPATGFQPSMQRAAAGGSRSVRQQFPAAMSATEAKGWAKWRLDVERVQAATASARVPLAWAGIRPGGLIRLSGAVWRVAEAEIQAHMVELALEPHRPRRAIVGEAERGRAASPVLPLAGATQLAVMPSPEGSSITVAAYSDDADWRGTDLWVSFDDGLSYFPAGRLAPAIVGRLVADLGAGEDAVLELELAASAGVLERRPDSAVEGGANRLLVGAETLSFAAAEEIGPQRYRLIGLVRSEASAAAHLAGETVLLLQPGRHTVIAPPEGAAVRLKAVGAREALGGGAASVCQPATSLSGSGAKLQQ